MPYIVKSEHTIVHPSHPDEWYKVRVPLEAGDFENSPSDPVARNLHIVGGALTGWSHPAPATRENVRHLDPQTLGILVTEIVKLAGFRPDDEKNESSANSSPTTGQEAAPSPPSSGI